MASGLAGAPSVAQVPADCTRYALDFPTSSSRRRKKPSAMGERHRFPVQTNKTVGGVLAGNQASSG
jgi:hypothetical protein